MGLGIYETNKKYVSQIGAGAYISANKKLGTIATTPKNNTNFLGGIVGMAKDIVLSPFTNAYGLGQSYRGTYEGNKVSRSIIASEERARKLAQVTAEKAIKKYKEGKMTREQLSKALASTGTGGTEDLLSVIPSARKILAQTGTLGLDLATVATMGVGGLGKVGAVAAKTLAKKGVGAGVRTFAGSTAVGMGYGATTELAKDKTSTENVLKSTLTGGIMGLIGGAIGARGATNRELVKSLTSKGISSDVAKSLTKEEATKILSSKNPKSMATKTINRKTKELTQMKEAENNAMDIAGESFFGGKPSVGAKGQLTQESIDSARKEMVEKIANIKPSLKKLSGKITEERGIKGTLWENTYNKALKSGKSRNEAGRLADEAISGKFKTQRTGFNLDISPQTQENLLGALEEYYRPGTGKFTNVRNALDKWVDQGILPQPSQIEYLEEGLNLNLSSLINQSKAGFIGKSIKEIGDLMRASMSSGDISGVGRQAYPVVALRMLTNPVETGTLIAKSLKYWGAGKGAETLAARWEAIRKDPLYSLMRKHKLSLTEASSKTYARSEEAFKSNLVDKIPLFGNMVKASDRQFSGVLNDIRISEFKKYVNKIDSIESSMEKIGKKLSADEKNKWLDAAAELANTATGRGNTPKSLKAVSDTLNATLFSPKLLFSRLAYLNPAFYVKLPGPIRTEAIKQAAAMVGVATSMLATAKALGADVEWNPRSTDFAKIKLGNTRFEITGGFTPYLRTLAQLYTGQKKSTTTGEIGSTASYGQGGRLGTLKSFARGKLNPLVGTGVNIATGSNIVGEQTTARQILGGFTPMIAQDIRDALSEEDDAMLKALLVGSAGAIGAGANTYGGTEQTAKNKARTQYAKKKKTTGESIKFRLTGNVPK